MSNKFRASNRTSAERNSISLCKICGERITDWNSYKDKRPKNLDLSIHVCKEKKERYVKPDLDDLIK